MSYYRVYSGEKGIYEAVDNDCPKDSPLRNDKPDGSWLPRVGMHYKDCISFWTEEGYRKYVSSGLAEWHASVVSVPVRVEKFETLPGKLVYSDQYQAIVHP